MRDQTKQALEQFVQKMIAGAEQAGQFAVEQTPLLVQEWLRWQLAASLMWVVLLLVIVATGAGLARRLQREDDDEAALGVAFVLCLVPGIFALVHAFTALKVYVAPRVVILEKFMELVK